MDIKLAEPTICKKTLDNGQILKRKLIEDPERKSNKKIKIDVSRIPDGNNSKTKQTEKCKEASSSDKITIDEAAKISETVTKVSSSPKKRLELVKPPDIQKNKEKFIYGNYNQYYGYRNNGHHDIRLDVFMEHRHIFENKDILDIGCNSGFITVEVAKIFEVKSIVGLDIDKSLINHAVKNLSKLKKSLPLHNELNRLHKFPFNVKFVHGNYVLKDDVLLEIETNQFDLILCLSITKWIHLNFGDEGLKQAFKRMFLQLKPNGKLILEAQPYDNYARRKKMTDTIFKNFKSIKFFPKGFAEYLLSAEIGFSKMELMGVPDHCKQGFKRPIQIFSKS